ncbi:MAG: T9SS type A sorting domain-containing protein [Rhodothermales bacterium]|nr:T9SS type A sorting domain-containing protein [Rhodothermales bacterium]MBO6781462.1 T9SS type A sorting domain-containing protein [Rhodothermales bacterium]
MVVRAEAFAFATSGIVGNSTFYRFAIENPTADSLSVYAGIFLDGSSGAWGDEFAGTDTSRSMVYLYGGDDDDGLFGPASPALGATILKAPTVGGREGRIGASHIPSDDGGRYGWPTDAAGYHNFVRGLIQDGSPVREGGGGGGRDGPVTTFGYPGDPVSGAFWSMVNSDGSGTSFSPVGQEMFIYAQPFTLPPGGSDEMVFALAWAQGANRFDSIVRLRDGVDFLRERRNALLHSRDGDSLPDPPAAPDPRLVLGLADNAPNPFGSETLITASIPIDAHIRLEVFDSLGRSVGLLQDGEMDKGRYSWLFYGADLAPGVYFYRLSVDSYTFSKPMVVAR